MKQGDQAMLAVAVVLGVGAWLLLRPREPQAATQWISLPGSATSAPAPTWSPPLRREPATVPSAEPTMLEQAGAWIYGLFAEEPTMSTYRSPKQWRELLTPEFRKWENHYGLPTGFLEAIAERESGFRDAVITCQTLGKVGEKGLMQIWPKYHPDKGCGPIWSIEYAAGFFREHFNRYKSWPLAIMAWNWGSGNMDELGIAAVPQKTKDYIAFIGSKVDLA
jgi:soluble lytic murein transglycosylase-like protein